MSRLRESLERGRGERGQRAAEAQSSCRGAPVGPSAYPLRVGARSWPAVRIARSAAAPLGEYKRKRDFSAPPSRPARRRSGSVVRLAS